MLITFRTLITSNICKMMKDKETNYWSKIMVQHLAYVVYTCMSNFIGFHMIYNTFSVWFFKLFKFFLVLLILYCLKTYLIYIWPLIYLFVLGRDRLFTAYICFKETLFFNFSYKYEKSYLRALDNLGCQ